jgi:hypothetical protein
MNEFTENEQAFLDACGAIGVEPNAMGKRARKSDTLFRNS